MDFETLENYIKNTMEMSHIYQPVMLKTILKTVDLKATKEEIATQFLSNDRSKIGYYRKRLEVHPHKTLYIKHKILSYERQTKNRDGTYSLDMVEDLTNAQRTRLIELCDSKIKEFKDKEPWILRIQDKLDQKTPDTDYAVYAKCKGRCVACGVGADKRILHVDHIFPESLGGSRDISNLQVLCSKCNTEKRNTDATDFLAINDLLAHRQKGCGLCKTDGMANMLLASNYLAFSYASRLAGIESSQAKPSKASLENIPKEVQIAPKRHVRQFADLIMAEKQLCHDLVNRTKTAIMEEDPSHEPEVVFDSHKSREEHCTITVYAR